MRPELVAEVKFLTWTEDNLLRQVVYEGLREDKPAAEVRRDGAASQSGQRCSGPEKVSADRPSAACIAGKEKAP